MENRFLIMLYYNNFKSYEFDFFIITNKNITVANRRNYRV